MMRSSFFKSASEVEPQLREYVPIIYLVATHALQTLRAFLAFEAQFSHFNINEKNCDGDCALTLAAKYNNFAMVKLLCEHGANIYAQDSLRHSALDWAREHKNQQMEDFLTQQLTEMPASYCL